MNKSQVATNEADFHFTWEDLVRFYKDFSAYENKGFIRGEDDLRELLRRAEIGAVSSKDLDLFYSFVNKLPGSSISFAV